MTEAGYSRTVFDSSDVIGQLSRLRQDGVRWLAIQVPWYQASNRSVVIQPSAAKTPSDQSVSRLIRAARAHGLRVFLNPFVNSRQGSGWQADFDPSSVPAWFHSFDHYLAHYAKLAQADHANLFAIGDEFDSLDSVPAYQRYWLHAIAVARRYYSGPIVYGADWPDYQRVTFWRALNDVGIDAYFPLSTAAHPSQRQLDAAWTKEADAIQAWRRRAGLTHKPLVITELGYPSEVGAAANPGTWYPTEPVDLRIQAQCYQAVLSTIYQRPWLAGLFWFWWANPSNPDWAGGPTDNGYTPRGKPAERTLRRWFAGTAHAHDPGSAARGGLVGTRARPVYWGYERDQLGGTTPLAGRMGPKRSPRGGRAPWLVTEAVLCGKRPSAFSVTKSRD